MKKLAAAVLLAGVAFESMAEGGLTIPMNVVDENGVGAKAGQVVVSETKYGLVFTPALAGMPAGLHGFHVHENPSCQPKEKDGKKVAALAAGGHYDPLKTGKHGFPWGDGHLGDLPPLYVDSEGKATQAVLAPRLKLADLAGRSLMIHVGGDNHADHPAPLGGGGARIVCGVNP
ncbi:MAG: superoxide dismutase family protein [Sterolibacteriaceae bacterium]|nr:superoxide dismutase family protein [Sterolibacteriaceae bacterium]